jgi:hypothetical protein
MNFLITKGYQELFHYTNKLRPNELPSHEQMLHAGTTIELNAGARDLFKDMKEAWRQQRSRNKKKQTGHLVSTFTLNGETKYILQRMAKALDISATALLEKLIAKAYQSHLRKQDKQPHKQPTQTLQGDRSDTLADIKNTLSGEVFQPDSSAVNDCALRECSDDENSSVEQPVIITGTIPSTVYLANEHEQISNAAKNTFIPKKRKKYNLLSVEQTKRLPADHVEKPDSPLDAVVNPDNENESTGSLP